MLCIVFLLDGMVEWEDGVIGNKGKADGIL